MNRRFDLNLKGILASCSVKIFAAFAILGALFVFMPVSDSVYAAEALSVDRILVGTLNSTGTYVSPDTATAYSGWTDKDTPIFTLHAGSQAEIALTYYNNSRDGYVTLNSSNGTELERYSFTSTSALSTYKFTYTPDHDEEVYVEMHAFWYHSWVWGGEFSNILCTGTVCYVECKAYNNVPVYEQREPLGWATPPKFKAQSSKYVTSVTGVTNTYDFKPTSLTYYYTTYNHYQQSGSMQLAICLYNTDDPDTPFYSETLDNVVDQIYQCNKYTVYSYGYLSKHELSPMTFSDYAANFAKDWYVQIEPRTTTASATPPSYSITLPEIDNPSYSSRYDTIESIPASVWSLRDSVVVTYQTAPQIYTDLSDVTAVEGSSDTLLTISGSFPSGNELYLWEYCLPESDEWNEITDTLALYTYTDGSGHKQLYTSEQLTAMEINPDACDATRFLPAAHKAGLDNTMANSYSIKLVNPQVDTIDGIRVRVTLKSASSDTMSSEAVISVIPTSFTALSSYMSVSSLSVGTVVDPSDVTRFINIVSYNNGVTRYYTNRYLRFIADGDLTLDEIKAKIKTEVPKVKIKTVNGYDDTSTYEVGDFVSYNNMTYECADAVTVAGSFDPAKWTVRENVTHGYAYKDNDGVVHDASYWADTETFYITGYSLEELGASNDPSTGCGTLTSYTATLEYGENHFFIIIPDMNDLTRSVVSAVSIEGTDAVEPEMSEIEARWAM